jgi:CrcB protein
MLIYIWVGLGGAIGTIFRFFLSSLAARRFGEVFPWGTLIINVTGAFLIGFCATISDPAGLFAKSPFAIFFMVGICGGYTTFSSFSLQTLRLVQDGQFFYAVANVVGSNLGCFAAVWLGHEFALLRI